MSRAQHIVTCLDDDDLRPAKSAYELTSIIGVRRGLLGIDPASLPFSPDDVTAGSESELQTAVRGSRFHVDLPLFIEHSNYFRNTKKRIKTGDVSSKKLTDLEHYLQGTADRVWENSWVRFPRSMMGGFAGSIFAQDLTADKTDPHSGLRGDCGNFLFQHQGEEYVRMPLSYLLKISLAQALSSETLGVSFVRETGLKLMDHFLNDNTSPETSSFYVIRGGTEVSPGRGVSREMSLRYLLTQLLVEYANVKFCLRDSGQEAMIFFSPHPPIRQKKLSNLISDSFYRELFMNPCLSGWVRGEEKHKYMHLCHQVLSRSQFNAAIKLREAGIITSNLVALPNLSNISLANNGTHVSLGSVRLTELLKDPSSGFTRRDEKNLGDLVVKIVEHFLSLFVGTYTAAPYRLAFEDFHPERALGFLPHELDFTHLRMLWRRWRKKADLSILGQPLTPFGPASLDRIVSRLFGLRGDYIPDFRLIDYLVALMSTDESPALNGQLGNTLSLKRDLQDLGIFDTQMSVYLFEKLRECAVMGFSGFEARHYSLFESFEEDMARAVNLQNLLYLLAFKYIASGEVNHASIPDDPFAESERRQIIFGSAINVPTFFVRRDTPNNFLRKILARTAKTRASARYGGYLRVYNLEYRLALVETLRADAADLIEMTGMGETLDDLVCRLRDPGYAVSGRLTRGILGIAGARKPLAVDAEIFNAQAERFYRTTLRERHLREAFASLEEAFPWRASSIAGQSPEVAAALKQIVREQDPGGLIKAARTDLPRGGMDAAALEKMIALLLLEAKAAEEKNVAGGRKKHQRAA